MVSRKGGGGGGGKWETSQKVSWWSFGGGSEARGLVGKGPASLQHLWSTGTATASGQHPTGLRLIPATSLITAAHLSCLDFSA